MERGCFFLHGTDISYSFLKDDRGNWAQFYYSIVPGIREKTADQVRTIERAEIELFSRFNILPETITFKRFFSSDLINHREEIRNYKKRQSSDFFLSLTEQPPATNVKLSLLGMCLNNIKPGGKARKENIFYFDTTAGVRHIFFEQLTDPEADENSDSELQTGNIFGLLKKRLSEFGTTVEDSVLRTWLYSPHLDADYPGIVRARNDFFSKINLNSETHYIASTGIQGGSGERFARVSMDVYAVIGISKEQIRYIQAPEYLSPTHIYGVAFERATAALLGKSDFLFISGTASIDKKGDIVYPGDIEKQTGHTLLNISALLDSAGFSKTDLSSAIIYLRDQTDYSFVKPLVDQYTESLPAIYVKAPVCRPGWLIEIEATAARIAK